MTELEALKFVLDGYDAAWGSVPGLGTLTQAKEASRLVRSLIAKVEAPEVDPEVLAYELLKEAGVFVLVSADISQFEQHWKEAAVDRRPWVRGQVETAMSSVEMPELGSAADTYAGRIREIYLDAVLRNLQTTQTAPIDPSRN